MKTKYADVLIIVLMIYAIFVCAHLSEHKSGDTLAMAEQKIENQNK